MSLLVRPDRTQVTHEDDLLVFGVDRQTAPETPEGTIEAPPLREACKARLRAIPNNQASGFRTVGS